MSVLYDDVKRISIMIVIIHNNLELRVSFYLRVEDVYSSEVCFAKVREFLNSNKNKHHIPYVFYRLLIENGK